MRWSTSARIVTTPRAKTAGAGVVDAPEGSTAKKRAANGIAIPPAKKWPTPPSSRGVRFGDLTVDPIGLSTCVSPEGLARNVMRERLHSKPLRGEGKPRYLMVGG